jgi:hypothetical protein
VLSAAGVIDACRERSRAPDALCLGLSVFAAPERAALYLCPVRKTLDEAMPESEACALDK